MQRRTGLSRKQPLRSAKTPLTASKLSKTGKHPVSKLKRDIQAQLRELVIKRDGGCILRHYSEAGECGGFRKDGELILQAEHLVTRSNSGTFAEPDNIVCLCQRHHFYFKPQHPLLYWELVAEHVGPKRYEKVRQWATNQNPHRMTERDWVNVSLYLQSLLK